ncbi:MAG: FAD:protein FMN transferase [Bacteroidaceae bacterium]|nr:FAD:protein FMN transferase [Bacteroidaceae bacterium]
MTDPLNPINLQGQDESGDQGDAVKFSPLTPDDAPKSQWRRWHLPVLFLFAIATFLIILRRNAPAPFQHNEGAIFGTFYHFTYQAADDLHAELKAELNRVDNSLSMFNPQSTLSRINQGEDIEVDSLFRRVFTLSQQVSEATDGAFDITVAPLVNAWGFGFKEGQLPDSLAVDSLRQSVGYRTISLTPDCHLHRDDPRTILDCSAVAKGFGVDIVADFLRARGILNYMVEIGGEIVVSGTNPKGQPWHVGVNKPDDDPTSQNSQLQTVLNLTDCALATSGNYRNFYITEDGRRLAHTIDPATGYPVQHSLLSSTVIAPTCACADAFATAFMVLGIERAKQVLSHHPELQVYFIYDSAGINQTFSTIPLPE